MTRWQRTGERGPAETRSGRSCGAAGRRKQAAGKGRGIGTPRAACRSGGWRTRETRKGTRQPRPSSPRCDALPSSSPPSPPPPRTHPLVYCFLRFVDPRRGWSAMLRLTSDHFPVCESAADCCDLRAPVADRPLQLYHLGSLGELSWPCIISCCSFGGNRARWGAWGSSQPRRGWHWWAKVLPGSRLRMRVSYTTSPSSPLSSTWKGLPTLAANAPSSSSSLIPEAPVAQPCSPNASRWLSPARVTRRQSLLSDSAARRTRRGLHPARLASHHL